MEKNSNIKEENSPHDPNAASGVVTPGAMLAEYQQSSKPRRPHHKSRTGCQNCKVRKVKVCQHEIVCFDSTPDVVWFRRVYQFTRDEDYSQNVASWMDTGRVAIVVLQVYQYSCSRSSVILYRHGITK